MPLWAILALSGGGLGAMQGAEEKKQADIKRQIDIATARTSGFTGQHPTFTAEPSMLSHIASGAFSGAAMGLANAQPAEEAAPATKLTQPELGSSAASDPGKTPFSVDPGSHNLMGGQTADIPRYSVSPSSKQGIYGDNPFGQSPKTPTGGWDQTALGTHIPYNWGPPTMDKALDFGPPTMDKAYPDFGPPTMDKMGPPPGGQASNQSLYRLLALRGMA